MRLPVLDKNRIGFDSQKQSLYISTDTRQMVTIVGTGGRPFRHKFTSDYTLHPLYGREVK